MLLPPAPPPPQLLGSGGGGDRGGGGFSLGKDVIWESQAFSSELEGEEGQGKLKMKRDLLVT